MGARCPSKDREVVRARGALPTLSSPPLKLHHPRHVTHHSWFVQTSEVKLQIVTLAAKLLVLSPSDRTIGLLNRYVFSLARYDLNYDVRDRGRMLGALLTGVNSNIYGENDDLREEVGGVVLRREQVRMVLFEGKASPADDAAKDGEYAIHSVCIYCSLTPFRTQMTTMAALARSLQSLANGRVATTTFLTGWKKALNPLSATPKQTSRKLRHMRLSLLQRDPSHLLAWLHRSS